MSYQIRTIEFHQNQLKNATERNAVRVQEMMDSGDVGLSSWGDMSMSRFHNHAIELLQQGLDITGEEIPYSTKKCLKDLDGNIVAVNVSHNERFDSSSWVVDCKTMADKLGRKFIPCNKHSGSMSRIQKKLGLVEESIFARCKPYLIARCSGIGSPVTFKSVVDDHFLITL